MSDLKPKTSNNQPLVTIGISTYNRATSTFPEALRSALAQGYRNLEVVVCDNASDDGTEAFMAQQEDPRVRYLRHRQNVGANGNFNACLDHAQGRYFLLLHDDDVLAPDFVQRAVDALAGREPGVLLGGVAVIDAQGRVVYDVPSPPPGLSPAELFLHWFGGQMSFYFCSTLFDTARLRADGGFSTPEDLFQDVVAIARLVSRYGYVTVPGLGGHFRRHEANRGAAGASLRWARDGAFLLEELRRQLPEDADRLDRAGQPYLAGKAYRSAATVPSRTERQRLYAEIDSIFGHALPPWRYALQARTQRLRRVLGRLVRWSGRLAGRTRR